MRDRTFKPHAAGEEEKGIRSGCLATQHTALCVGWGIVSTWREPFTKCICCFPSVIKKAQSRGWWWRATASWTLHSGLVCQRCVATSQGGALRSAQVWQTQLNWRCKTCTTILLPWNACWRVCGRKDEMVCCACVCVIERERDGCTHVCQDICVDLKERPNQNKSLLLSSLFCVPLQLARSLSFRCFRLLISTVTQAFVWNSEDGLHSYSDGCWWLVSTEKEICWFFSES